MINILPLLGHELRAAVRRPGAYRLRLGAGGAAVGLSCWGLLIWSDWNTATSLGHSLLEILGWTGFVGCALAALLLTSDCVSRERREGTLGLLFLTDLRGHDVALGKLAAKGIVPLYCLLSMFPSLAVCLIVGGVTAGEVWRLMLVLLNTLFFSMSVTILTSTLCRRQGAAQGFGLVVILFFMAALPLLGAVQAGGSGRGLGRSLCFLLSPAGNHLQAYDTHYRSAAGGFWSSLVATHLLAWVSLVLAGRLLPRVSWEDSAAYLPRAETGGMGRRLGDLAGGRPTRVELLSRNPMAWLASRDATRPRWIWSVPALAAWFWVGFDPNPYGNASSRTSFALIVGLHALFKMWVGADASREFSMGRLNGTLELLLATRLEPRDVAAGMLAAFRIRFLGPLMALLVTDAALARGFLAANNLPAALIVGALALMLPADLYCLCWVGLWRGLVARDPARAMAATIFRVLVLPCIFFGMGVALFVKSTMSEFAGLWVFIGIVSDVAFLLNARDFFHGHFRTMALRPFGARPPRVESKWSPMNWETEAEAEAKPKSG